MRKINWESDPAEYFKKKKMEEIERLTPGVADDKLQELFDRPCTDAGNMERLAGLCESDWLFNDENEKSRSWLHWNGQRWKAGNGGGLMLKAIDIMRSLQAYGEIKEQEAKVAKQNANTDEEKDKADKKLKYLNRLISHLIRSENKAPLNNMQDVFAKRQLAPTNTFDQDGWLLNVDNGTINLKTGKLQQHSREDYITKICRAAYTTRQPGVNLWEKTVAEILPDPDVRDWVQRFFGYCIIGKVIDHIFVVFYGDGGTGKGTLCESIADVLDEYASTINVDVLLTGVNESGNAPTCEIAKLVGKRLVLASESNRSRKFNEAKIKNLSGGDTITCRHLFGKPFQYMPQYKIILQSNYLPTITDGTDHGMIRRLYIVPFSANLKHDPALRDKLKAERDNILRWLVVGCLNYQRQGLAPAPAKMEALRRQYFHDNDVFELWLETCCRKDETAKLKTVTALKSYNNYAAAGNYRSGVNIRTFNDMLRRHGFEVKRDHETTKIRGLYLTELP